MKNLPVTLFSFLFILLTISTGSLLAQEDCNGPFGKTFGSLIDDARGYCVVASPEEHVVYVGGIKNDSVAILRITANGELDWIRLFDMVPGMEDHLNGMILDSDGMLGLAGTSGAFSTAGIVFAFRYDPAANTVLWANRLANSGSRFCSGIIELGTGGNYLVFTNPISPNNAELLELDRTTGQLNPDFSKHYHLGSSETFFDFVFHGEDLYGSARYTDGGTLENMRNTIVKLNAEDGAVDWALLGHQPPNVDARLYNVDLVIHQNKIYSVTAGDADGISIDFTDVFIQKTSLDGTVEWLKKYDLPRHNDWADEIFFSDGGLVVLARNRVAPSDIYLFKVNTDGEVLWGRSFDFGKNDNSVTLGGVTSQITELDGHLYFTAGSETAGKVDMLLVKTNLNGELSDSCGLSGTITIPVDDISTEDFYFKETSFFTEVQELSMLDTVEGIESTILAENICGSFAIISEIHASICEGESYEQYSVAGVYQDTFLTSGGCDSIRVLHLTMTPQEGCCGSFTSAILGETGVRERGFALSPTHEQDGFYVAGLQSDSLLLMEVDLNGVVRWSRVIDVVPGKDDYAAAIITDSEGMIGVSGMGADDPNFGGSGWVMRYDPYTQSILWVREVLTQQSRDLIHGLSQNGPGGDYMLICNTVNDIIENDDALITFFDMQTGAQLSSSKNFNVSGNSENIYEFHRQGNFLYGVGRFTDGDDVSVMRHAIIKLNAGDFSVVWTKLGHQPQNVNARLYGRDMIISGEHIYSLYGGDPSGVSTTNTKMYVQKTTLDGELVWLRQYELPHANEYGNDLVESDGGIVLVDFKKSSPGTYYLVKIDFDGEVLWAKSYEFEAGVNTAIHAIGSSQLVQAGDKLAFTGYRDDGFGEEDIIIVRTDLNGETNAPCVVTNDITVAALTVQNPVFYNVNTEETNVALEILAHQGGQSTVTLHPVAECLESDTTITNITAVICEGESYESYTLTGVYQDTFVAQNGCDSIRILHLFVTPLTITTIQKEICSGQSFEGYSAAGFYQDTFSVVNECDSVRALHLFVLNCEPIVEYDLNACRSYMVDGSHMDYSEFTPEYPTSPECADVDASVVFRSADPMNKHSCTPGIANSEAMCISTHNSCTYDAGNARSLIIEINVDPQVDSAFRLTGLEFYEKSPVMYTWIDGPSGPNDYPRLYGIRILKNGTEIYRQTDIETTTGWTLQSFDFTDDLFRTEEPALFRIELLPYCPVGNGAEVSAWDVDEFRIFGACGTVVEIQPVVHGFVSTRFDATIPGVSMMLDKDHGFGDPLTCQTSFYGQYAFNAPDAYEDYYVKGYKNDDLLNGVNTLDMLAIQKHLLGKTPFTTLHQYVAADINNNGSVSAMDILDLRKALLGIKNEFPRNTSWRFGTLPQDFSGSDLFAFRETGHVDFKGTDSIQSDFVGIKIGDLNYSATLHAGDFQIGSRTGSTILMKIPDVEFESGEYITIPVTLNEALHVEGLQLVLDAGSLVLHSVEGGVIDISRDNVHYVDGSLRISWSHPLGIDISAHDVLFTMTFFSARSGRLSNLVTLTENVLRPEIYTSLADVHDLDLQWNEPSADTYNDFAFTAVPNPFHSELTVRFFLPSPEEVQISFFDVSGKLIYKVEKEYGAGMQIESIKLDYSGSGSIIFCQLISRSHTEVIKLVQSR